MENIILWSSVGIFALALIIGLCVGLSRGLKRSAVHLAFLVVSILVAFFLTKTITNAVLGIRLPIDDGKYTISEYILYMVEQNFDISTFSTAEKFISNLPNAIVSPIVFILLSLVFFLIFDIFYLITARLVFGKKKEDFKEHSPYRAYGGVIGIVEGIIVIILIFAPISALAGVYKDITYVSENAQTASYSTVYNVDTEAEILPTETSGKKLKSISQTLSDALPEKVDTAILSWDKSVIGKLTGVFGLDNAMFDSLSNFKLSGQKVVLRTELKNLVFAYDDFVDVYNLFVDKNYGQIHLLDLRTSLSDVLDGNFFKTVVADSVDTFVLEYEEVKSKLGINAPLLLDKIVAELNESFSQAGFNTSEYLKQDIMSVLDAFDIVFSNDLITKYNNLESKKFISIMDYINENNSAVGNVATKLCSLNLVKDSFPVLIDEASKKVEKSFQNENNLTIKLNNAIENNSETIDALLSVVTSVTDLNKSIDFAKILSTDDIVETLTSADNIYNTMREMGRVFDEIRNLKILILPPQNEGEEEVYVFDNILKYYNVELLGDEVYIDETSTTKVKLDSYTKFFDFIAGPIDIAKDLGLTDLGKEGVTFDSILDRVLFALELDDTVLTRVITPFYQLSAMDLKGLVFDKVIDNLQTNVSILDFSSVSAENDYFVWAEEFNQIGKTMKLLNQGRGEIEGYDGTYIKYLISETSDLEKAMTALNNNGRLSDVLDKVFTARVFEKLTNDIFTVLDDSVKELTGTTGIALSSDLTNLTATKENTIQTIVEIFGLVWNNQELSLTDYGTILNLLKTNAYNNGTKDGVFNNIFTNVIWYLTGDDLTEGNVFANCTPNENAEDIKAYLNVTDYYDETVDYETLMAEIDEVIDFVNKLNENVDFTASADNSATKIVDGIELSLEGKTEEGKVSVVTNLNKLLSNKNEKLLREEDKAVFGDDLKQEIQTRFENSSELATQLLLALDINE